MTILCNDRERIFHDGTPEEWAALETHAGNCSVCSEEVRAWKNLSAAAAGLHRQWDSPSLWPQIEQALSQQAATSRNSWWKGLFGSWSLAFPNWATALAALLFVTLTGFAIWFVTHPVTRGIPQNEALLSDRTVNEVQRAEAAYERAIDKLDAEVRPQLEDSSAPLMANYREKLLVLDSAIADLKSQAGMNPANGHLRRQLLAMYQEKQDTLEQVLEVKK